MPETAILSAIVISPGRFEAVSPLLRRLRSQTICERIEIVFVTPELSDICSAERELLEGFSSWKTVSTGPMLSMAAARETGVRAAGCDYIVFTEEHCFPENEWAQAIIHAFEREEADVVGPVFLNANPGLALSWAIFLQEYGAWAAPHTGGWMDHLPGHNSAYRREQLLALGKDLKAGIEGESALHFEWRAQGRRLWLEPGARVHHVNITAGRAALTGAYVYQRAWANRRAQHWSWSRRLLYALASPVIPLVRLRRCFTDMRRAGVAGDGAPRILPWICVTLTASALGEFLGYVGYAGKGEVQLIAVELHRRDCLDPRDADGLACFSDQATNESLADRSGLRP
jgi:hypothetical protein